MVLDHGHTDLVLGAGDRNLKLLDNLIDADFFARGNTVRVVGPGAQVRRGTKALAELDAMARAGREISPDAVRDAVRVVGLENERAVSLGPAILSRRGKAVRPKTPGQRAYVEAIERNTIVFGIGPAGTGKTYLAVAKAVAAFKAGEVQRIVLTRPAVEAGEKLGFLPGTLDEKIDPYLRPLYDALRDMLGAAALAKLVEAGVVEVAPLAYMRGRTLSGSFVILDEAQNTTPEQMKMFLTRLGFSSKMVVTGDITQVDLPGGRTSGLREAREALRGISGIHIAELGSADVVRHALVGRIVEAYDRFAERRGK